MRDDSTLSYLASLINNNQPHELNETLLGLDLAELVTIIEETDSDKQAYLLKILPLTRATQAFEYLKIDTQILLLKELPEEMVAQLLNGMAPDDRTTLLGYLPGPVVRELIRQLSPEERKVTVSLLGYPDSSVGRLMTPDYVAIRQEWTVAEVLDYVRQHGQDSETLSFIYVVDERGILIDDIRIREFLLAPLDKKVNDIMDWKFVALGVMQDQEEAISIFRKNGRMALPVVDASGLLLGMVTIDDILDVVEEEETEDIQKVGGSEALEEPYTTIPILQMVKKRAGWLVVLFLGEMLTATAMGYFEEEIAKAVVLALFVPLIISSGGNSGSQATTLIIRAMALGEISLRDWWRVMRRELLSGLMLGLILGIIGFLRIALWSQFSQMYGPHWLLVACTVGFSLIGVVLWGCLSGSMLPLILRRLKFDPATSSAPFVATLVDVTGLVIYFSVALIFLRGTLL